MTLSWDGLRGEAFTRLEASTKGRGTFLHCTGSAPQSSSTREIIINSPTQRHTAVCSLACFCLSCSDILQRAGQSRPPRGVAHVLRRKYACFFKQIFRQTFDPFGSDQVRFETMLTIPVVFSTDTQNNQLNQ